MQTKLHTQTDNNLRDSVLRQLEWEPRIASQDIAVAANDGAVTLTGFVHSFFEKRAAETAAKGVYGVRAIANDIQVKSSGRTDPEIARDVIEAMRIDMSVPDSQIKAAVNNGFVTLDGSVEWHFQRDAAERCAARVSGVRSVDNNIVLKSHVSTAVVR